MEYATPQLHNIVTRDAVVYLHPIIYNNTTTATRYRHPIYVHVPGRRASRGPTFQQSELSKQTQMDR